MGYELGEGEKRHKVILGDVLIAHKAGCGSGCEAARSVGTFQ